MINRVAGFVGPFLFSALSLLYSERAGFIGSDFIPTQTDFIPTHTYSHMHCFHLAKPWIRGANANAPIAYVLRARNMCVIYTYHLVVMRCRAMLYSSHTTTAMLNSSHTTTASLQETYAQNLQFRLAALLEYLTLRLDCSLHCSSGQRLALY